MTDEDLRLYQDSILAAQKEPMRSRSRIAFGNYPPPPETMPAFAPDIHVDSELNLWVREYARPGDPNVIWSVFTDAGLFLGKVHMPRMLEILDIGPNVILGLVHDQDDVEYVQLYELVKGR